VHWFRTARILAWNAVAGILLLELVRYLWLPTLPILWWPLALAVIFGFPGTIVAILLWKFALVGH
jgi:hypothetical protein